MENKLSKRLSSLGSDAIGSAVEDIVSQAIMQRRNHERRWYDNNFFDDGYHFRVISRKTGRVIDHIDRQSGYIERAIPRASRQIRGVANLLFAAEPYPVVYPERTTAANYMGPDGQVNLQAYEQAKEQSKQVARKQGIWLATEWEDQRLPIKLIDLLIMAAKNAVAYIQVYSDTEKQQICTEVFDAFDIILYGDRRNIQDVPFVTKTKAMEFTEVLSSSLFDGEKVKKLTPDNRYATSEIKNAYMNARYGTKIVDKGQATLIVKETFLKESLSDENWKQAVKLDAGGSMEGKSKGDTIMRHVFSAGGVTLGDEYINYDKYPFAAFQFEPGPLYQVPFIERFIPQNKSLDVIVTRLEKWINAMVVGVYQKRKGENFQVSNFPGGQMIEFESTPLTQMQTASVGNTPFGVIELMNKYIDEQGATTSALGQLPQGVKSGVAIESVKSTDYANLKISTLMLKDTIKSIAESMLERADKDYLEPKEVASLEDGEPDYFDVIGQRGYQLSQQINKPLPQGIIPLKKNTKVRIEIEPGLGLTMEGKKEAMNTIMQTMIELVKEGLMTKESLQMVVKRFLEAFGYGSTQEFMEALDEGVTKEDMTQDQITKMKIAIVEALRDSGAVGPEMEKRMVDSTKVGVVEAMKDTGMLDKSQQAQAQPVKVPSESISFKDLPPEGQVQMAQQAGIQLNPQQIQQNQAVQASSEVAKQSAINKSKVVNKPLTPKP